jgi:hypothetical protein
LNLQNLDDVTREYMLSEIERDTAVGNVYLSAYLSSEGRSEYPDLLRCAVIDGDDATLADALARTPGLFVSHYEKKKPKGGFTIAKVPVTAPTTCAEGEFNRFYIRALCRRVVDGGGGVVEVYRARESSWARPESEALIGAHLDAADLLEDLRSHIGEAPTLLPEVNSGLSVRLL